MNTQLRRAPTSEITKYTMICLVFAAELSMGGRRARAQAGGGRGGGVPYNLGKRRFVWPGRP